MLLEANIRRTVYGALSPSILVQLVLLFHSRTGKSRVANGQIYASKGKRLSESVQQQNAFLNIPVVLGASQRAVQCGCGLPPSPVCAGSGVSGALGARGGTGGPHFYALELCVPAIPLARRLPKLRLQAF